MIAELFFWVFLIVLIYTYIGYAFVLYLILLIKIIIWGKDVESENEDYEPDVCLFVTAYNEKDFVIPKVENSFQLDYPKEKIQYLWITDGSDDGTPEILKKYNEIEVHHLAERRGKAHAMNRGMKFVNAPIIIFSDTNTVLNKQAIREIVTKFSNPDVGCVAGEKRIVLHDSDNAATAGEGLYWKFESWVKKMDARLNTAVGAVGELFAIRKDLFEDVRPDTILDDFVISMRIAERGFKIAYAPDAYAKESASLNVKEELKRKIRITAGGVQSMIRLRSLLNPFKNGCLTWQYISHKVLRWTLAPFSLFAILFLNVVLVWERSAWFHIEFYTLFFYLQLAFYLSALVGWLFENKKLQFKILFVPYYFVSINYASLKGISRFFKGKQSVKWEKSRRA